MTIRQYAEQLKQACGTVLGVYEAYAGVADPAARKTAILGFVNALPDTALAGLGGMFQNTSQISDFVIAVGPSLGTANPTV